MPSCGTHGLRKYGQKRTSTAMSGRSAIAFSSRRLPMKHQGHTTSETISIGRAEVMAGSSCGPARLGPRSLGGNLGMAAQARHQCADVVGGPARGEGDRRPDPAAVTAGWEHGAPELARDPTRNQMGAAQIGLGEGREDRTVLLLAGEIDAAHEAAEKSRGIDVGAAIGDAFESETCNRKRAASLLALLHRAAEIAQESLRAEQARVGIDDSLAFQRFQSACELALERLQAHEWEDSLDEMHRIGFDAHQVGQTFVVNRGIVQHADRQIAKAYVLGEHGQQRLDDACTQALTDDDAVYVTRVEIAGGGLDAQRPNEPDAFADRDRKCGI